jgi:hypothetical protein
LQVPKQLVDKGFFSLISLLGSELQWADVTALCPCSSIHPGTPRTWEENKARAGLLMVWIDYGQLDSPLLTLTRNGLLTQNGDADSILCGSIQLELNRKFMHNTVELWGLKSKS